MKKLLGLFIVLFFSIHAIAGLSDPEELNSPELSMMVI